MNRLLIIFRTCSKETFGDFKECRPYFFDKKRCFKSFWDNFNNKTNTEINVVFDGNIDCNLYRYIQKFTNNIINVTFCQDTSTLIYCHEYASEKDFDFVYMLEDDFLHLENSYEKLLEGLNIIKNNGFVSLYDHLDRYIRQDDITLGKEHVLLGKTGYWRTAESTTNTVAMSKEILLKTLEEKRNCGNKDRLFFVNCINKYNLRLITPLPALSTHVNKFFYSPYINWEKYNNSIVL